METITLNGHEIEVMEIHDELPMVKFKFVRNWCKLSEAFIPNKTVVQWLMGLGANGFWNQEEKKAASNTLLRRWIDQGVIRINGKVMKQNDMLDFPVLSVIIFPKSERLYSTIF